mgnify:CR=1 FL=1
MKVPPMPVASAAVLLALLTASCASVPRDATVSQPEVVATQPAPATVPAPKVATSSPRPAGTVVPPVAKAAARSGPAPKPAASPVAAPAAPLTLDLNALKDRLRATKAIGIFTKIALKNQVDDLLGQFSQYYQGTTKLTMTDLRRSYNLLMMKVLSLLQDDDQTLASAIVSSRELIWGLLADPKTFAALQS